MSQAIDVLDDTLDAGERKGGALRGIGRLLTLPFRLVIGTVRLVLVVVRGMLRILFVPVRVAALVIRKIVLVASDITYGLWRFVAKLIGLVLGAVRFVFRVFNATVGGAVRLALRIVRGAFRTLFGVFRIGTKVGAAKATRA